MRIIKQISKTKCWKRNVLHVAETSFDIKNEDKSLLLIILLAM